MSPDQQVFSLVAYEQKERPQMANRDELSNLPMSSVVLFVFLLVSFALLLLACGGGSDSPGPSPGSCDFRAGGSCTISVNGETRSFVLHMPPRYQTNSSALVIALHGDAANNGTLNSLRQPGGHVSRHTSSLVSQIQFK